VPIQLLSVALGASMSLTAISMAARSRYVHEFRVYDLNFYSHMLLAIAQKDRDQSNAHKEVAKMWLRRSEDFRRQSLYLTFSSVHIIFSSFFFGLSLAIDYLANSFYYFPFSAVGFIFLLFSIIAYWLRYRSKSAITNLAVRFERMSWKLSSFFPPLPPPLIPMHLRRWKEISSLIERDQDLKEYLYKLPQNIDMRRHGLDGKLNSMEKAAWSTRTKCLLLYTSMLLAGILLLFFSYHYSIMFFPGLLLSSIGFHELCHLTALLVGAYPVDQILSSLFKFGMTLSPRNTKDAFFASMLPLVGVPLFFAVSLWYFPEYTYQITIYVFLLSLPDVYVLLKWVRGQNRD
jgi:hypothetical protein